MARGTTTTSHAQTGHSVAFLTRMAGLTLEQVVRTNSRPGIQSQANSVT